MDDFYEFLGFKEIIENKIKESTAELENQSDNVTNDVFRNGLTNQNQENS